MKQLFYIILLLPAMALAQSTTQNYVKNITYKQPTSAVLPASPSAAAASVSVTYLDGLGRPMQQVAHKQSGTGTDIVTPIVYDAVGRQTHDYLPVPLSTSNMGFTSNNDVIANGGYYNATNFGVDAPYRFSEKRLEASPLGRVLEQGAPGLDWAVNHSNDNDHTIKFEYKTNTDSEVRMLKANATLYAPTQIYNIAIVNSGHYPVNSLYKTITKDENWVTDSSNHTTEEFKNKQGQVVLKRTYNAGQAHDTYYVYDQFGNLTYVIPPLANGSTTLLNELCYQYRYDHRNRLVEKKLPGKQWEFIVYDKLDRVVATGPANSPFSNITASGWLMTKYDAFSRPILTAWKQATVTSSSRNALQVVYNGATATTISEKRTTGPTVNTTINGVAFNYTNVAEPKAGYHVLTVNYYDDYNYPNAPTTFSVMWDGSTNEVHYNTTNKPKGLATGSWVRVLETSTMYKNERSYMLYNNKARMVMNHKINHLGGYTKALTKYDFEGKVLQTQAAHKRTDGSSSSEVVVNDYYTYTDQGRLLEHRQKVNGGPEELIARNEYDALGQLKNKRVGGPSAGQGYQKVDYTYNIRGWLKGINDIGNLMQGNTSPSNPKDLFAFKLNYNTVENSVEDDIDELYNGNISETFWISDSDNIKRKYGYAYDDLNRLTDAIFQKPGLGGLGQQVTKAYNEEVDYDKNGNIIFLRRNGYQDNNNNGGYYQIDNLEYWYSNNQLRYVFDHSNSFNGFKDGQNPTDPNSPDYEYDQNGNMTQDWNKGIRHIAYNHLNLPVKIEFFVENGNEKSISYLYNALGVKLGKVVNDRTVTPSVYQQTDYLDGFQYVDSKLLFFPTSEGYVSVTDGRFNYVYNYTDHLGNIRLSYTKPKPTEPLAILEENHYYPFGMKHSNYGSDKYKYVREADGEGFVALEAVERSDYQYKYNGKEYQDELGLNMYDMDMRQYDPAIGRWVVQDPVVHHSMSPYNAFDNNPVFWADPSGADAVYNWGTGKYMDGDNEVSFATAMAGYGLNSDGSDKTSEDDGGNVAKPLTKSVLLQYVKENYCEDCSSGKLQQVTGQFFERQFEAFASGVTPSKFKFRRGTKLYGPRNTVPDFIADFIREYKSGRASTRVQGAVAYEVKAMNGSLYLSSNTNQLMGHIDNLSDKFRFMTSYGKPHLTLATTYDVNIGASVTKRAAEKGVGLNQVVSYYTMVNNQMIITFGPRVNATEIQNAIKN